MLKSTNRNMKSRSSISDKVYAGVSGKRFLESLRPQGVFVLTLRGPDGNIKDVRVAHNLVTNAGFAGIASRINGSGAEAAATYLAVGTGTTAAAAGNTTLETEITDSGLSRANATASRTTTTQTNDTATLVHTFSVTGTKAVTEAGVLNAASSGVLFARSVFAAVNVANGDTLQVTYDIAVAA